MNRCGIEGNLVKFLWGESGSGRRILAAEFGEEMGILNEKKKGKLRDDEKLGGRYFGLYSTAASACVGFGSEEFALLIILAIIIVIAKEKRFLLPLYQYNNFFTPSMLVIIFIFSYVARIYLYSLPPFNICI